MGNLTLSVNLIVRAMKTIKAMIVLGCLTGYLARNFYAPSFLVSTAESDGGSKQFGDEKENNESNDCPVALCRLMVMTCKWVLISGHL